MSLPFRASKGCPRSLAPGSLPPSSPPSIVKASNAASSWKGHVKQNSVHSETLEVSQLFAKLPVYGEPLTLVVDFF